MKRKVSILVCPKCGGYKTLLRAWVSANFTEEDRCPSLIFSEKGWCLDCEEEVSLKERFVSEKDYRQMETY